MPKDAVYSSTLKQILYPKMQCAQLDERSGDITSFQPQNIYFLTWAAKRTFFKRFFKNPKLW